MPICILLGRLTLLFVFASTGTTCGVSNLALLFGLVVTFSLSFGALSNIGESIPLGAKNRELGKGVDRAAGGSGAGRRGASECPCFSLVSRRVCILEYRRGKWKSIIEISGALSGMRLDMRFSGTAAGSKDGVDGERGGIVMTEGLAWTMEKAVEPGVTIIEAFLGESLTGERGRATWSAVGGALRVPLRTESRGRVVVVETGGVF